MRILVVNSGSSSLKYELRETSTQEQLLVGIVEEIGLGGVADHAQALELVAKHMERELGPSIVVDAVGHRVVHGGEEFSAPTLVTPEVIDAIEQLSPLAPLHNPAAVAGLRALRKKWPHLPQVVVFDTAFHRTMPEKAWRYAVPNVLYEAHGVRRYGFHGTSHEYVTRAAAGILGVPIEDFDAVVAHLGNGASVTAVQGGQSVDTSMGYTPLAGLVMGTRSGDVDPSAVTQLIERGLYTAGEMDVMLNERSGLRGLAGVSHMKAVVDRAEANDAAAQLALEVAAYRLQKYVGGYHVAVGGAQALVFTGGIGENSAPFRAMVCEGLGALGVALDAEANKVRSDEPRVVSTPESEVAVLVIPTDEEAAIAEATAEVASA